MRKSAFALALMPFAVSLAGNTESQRFSPPPEQEQSAVLVGAGDLADCRDLAGAEATAKLLDNIPGTVMAVGDLAYPDGSQENAARAGKSRVPFLRRHTLF